MGIENVEELHVHNEAPEPETETVSVPVEELQVVDPAEEKRVEVEVPVNPGGSEA